MKYWWVVILIIFKCAQLIQKWTTICSKLHILLAFLALIYLSAFRLFIVLPHMLSSNCTVVIFQQKIAMWKCEYYESVLLHRWRRSDRSDGCAQTFRSLYCYANQLRGMLHKANGKKALHHRNHLEISH